MTPSPDRAILRANIHFAVQAFAEAAGGVFVSAYFLKAGFSVSATLTILAAMLAGRFVLRPLILPFARRYGLKASLILGAILSAVTYPLVASIHGVGIALAIFCAVSALAGVFYWTCYHAYFAVIGDAEQRGSQVGLREGMVAVIGVVAPVLGGLALAHVGPAPTFWAIGLIQALSVVPLIGAPDVRVPLVSRDAFVAARQVFALMTVDGVFAAGFYYVWQIALFVTLGQNYVDFGGAVALATLVGALCMPLLGRFVDRGHGRRVVIAAYSSAAAVIALRAASLGSPWVAVAANAAGALVTALLAPAAMTVVYNLAQASPCALRFHIVTEGAWDIGCGAGCLIAAALVAVGLPLGPGILVSALAALGLMALLLRFYQAPQAAPA